MVPEVGGSTPLGHPKPLASLAARASSSIWQSIGLLIRRFWVRVPGGVPAIGSGTGRFGHGRGRRRDAPLAVALPGRRVLSAGLAPFGGCSVRPAGPVTGLAPLAVAPSGRRVLSRARFCRTAAKPCPRATPPAWARGISRARSPEHPVCSDSPCRGGSGGSAFKTRTPPNARPAPTLMPPANRRGCHELRAADCKPRTPGSLHSHAATGRRGGESGLLLGYFG